MSTKTTASNGTATATPAQTEKQEVKTSQPATITPENSPKPEALRQPAPQPGKMQSISERLERFALLEKYVGQLQLVEEALQELQEFKPDPSGGDQIIIKEADGTTHSTRHPEAVAAMVAAAVEKLKAKRAELESFIVL